MQIRLGNMSSSLPTPNLPHPTPNLPHPTPNLPHPTPNLPHPQPTPPQPTPPHPPPPFARRDMDSISLINNVCNALLFDMQPFLMHTGICPQCLFFPENCKVCCHISYKSNYFEDGKSHVCNSFCELLSTCSMNNLHSLYLDLQF